MSASPAPGGSSRPVRNTVRACDRCHARRVKCDGEKPCARCAKGAVSCSYDNPVQKKGPAPGQKRARQSETRDRRRSTSPRQVSSLAPVAGRGGELLPAQDSSPSGGSRSSVYDPGDWLSYSPEERQATAEEAAATVSENIADSQQQQAGPDNEGSGSRSQRAQQQGQSIDIGAISNLPLETVLRNIRLAQAGRPMEARTSANASGSQATSSTASRRRSDLDGWSRSRSGPYSRPRAENALQYREPSASVATSLSPRSGTGVSPANNRPSSASSMQLSQPIPRPVSAVNFDMDWDAMFAAGQMDFTGSVQQGAPQALNSAPPASTFNPVNFGSSGRLPTGILSPFAFPPAHISLGIPPPMPIVPPEEISPLFTLTLEVIIRPQLAVYVERIHPMIPVFSPEWLYASLDDPAKLANREHIAMILAMTALSLVHPLEGHEVHEKPTRARHATILMDEALRLSRKWDFGCSASYEACMTSYYLFGTLFELGYTSGAKLRLREAITLGETMGLDDLKTYVGLSKGEVQRRIRLYWILSVTERAYALQRSGNQIVFEGPISVRMLTSIESNIETDDEPISRSLRYLAQLFSVFDQDIVACWNGHCSRSNCTVLTRSRAVDILQRLDGSAQDVFGAGFAVQHAALTESQRSDLLVTWQWLKNRLWRLAMLHGLTREGEEPQLSGYYVYNAAVMTLGICQGLSKTAMEAHGTGWVEKLFDIISLVPVVLRDSPELSARLGDEIRTGAMAELLGNLFSYVATYRQGESQFIGPLSDTLTQYIASSSAIEMMT